MIQLKPFNIDKFLAGEVACTREGALATIIHVDDENEEFTALVLGNLKRYSFEGLELISRVATPIKVIEKYSNYNLGMLAQANEYWINVCQNESGVFISPDIFHSEKAAKEGAPRSVVRTILAYRILENIKTLFSFSYKEIIKGKFSNDEIVSFYPESFLVEQNAVTSGQKFCAENGYEYLGVVSINV